MKPILMSAPMVRALLDNRKTQTRRPIKIDLASGFDEPRGEADIKAGYPFVEIDGESVSAVKLAPYGQPGDRLFIIQVSSYVKGQSLEKRFFERVHIGGFNGCWEWFGRVDHKGYGVIKIGNKNYGAHRVSWELERGKIPAGKQIIHACDVRWCVNPSHLRIANANENNFDKKQKNRSSRQCREDNAACKLTDAQAQELKNLRSAGWEQKALGEKFGINQSQVSRILSGARRSGESFSPKLMFGSRYIQITDVRVQRIQDITEHDALEEGILPELCRECNNIGKYADGEECQGCDGEGKFFAVYEFKKLWQKIYPGSWERNEWVWVYTFYKRIS